MKAQVLILFYSLLMCHPGFTQDISGRWEADEVTLEITSILKSGIIELKQPRFGTVPVKNRHTAEFRADGTFQMHNESGTYRQKGNQIYADVNGKSEVYTIYRYGDQLQIWGENLVASQNQQERTNSAITMVRQMGMQSHFEFLQPTDRVSSIRAATYFRFAGASPQSARSNDHANTLPGGSDCSVSSSDVEQIKERVQNAAFDGDKPKILRDALRAKRCFSTDQIRELLILMSTDSYKLALAKYAYAGVTDRSNYDQIADVFEFNNTKDQLRTFIQSRR